MRGRRPIYVSDFHSFSDFSHFIVPKLVRGVFFFLTQNHKTLPKTLFFKTKQKTIDRNITNLAFSILANIQYL